MNQVGKATAHGSFQSGTALNVLFGEDVAYTQDTILCSKTAQLIECNGTEHRGYIVS